MKLLLLWILALVSVGTALGQSDSFPISISFKVNRKYTQKVSKKWPVIAAEIRENGLAVKGDSINQKLFDISVEIRNNADKTVKVWLMYCSWEDNFMTSNNFMAFLAHDCDKNYPSPVELKPGQKRIYTTTLTKSIRFDYPCKGCDYGKQIEATKIGLIIIDDIFKPALDILQYFDAMKHKAKWKIVWSNSLSL